MECGRSCIPNSMQKNRKLAGDAVVRISHTLRTKIARTYYLYKLLIALVMLIQDGNCFLMSSFFFSSMKIHNANLFNEFSPTNDDDDENSTYTLTFNIQFSHENDTVYFAHSFPYTYSDLQVTIY